VLLFLCALEAENQNLVYAFAEKKTVLFLKHHQVNFQLPKLTIFDEQKTVFSAKRNKSIIMFKSTIRHH